MEKQKNSFRVIWFFFKPYKLHILGLFILSLLVGGLEAANIAAFYPILSTAFGAGLREGNIIFGVLNWVASLLPIADEFIAYSVVFIVIALTAFAAKYVSIRFSVKFGAHLIENSQNQLFTKFIQADYQYFVEHKQGDLIYNVATAPNRLAVLVSSTTELITQVILSISVIAFLFSLSWQGTILVLLLASGYLYLTRYLGSRVSYHSGAGEREALMDSTVILNEVISGIKQVRVFSIADDCINGFNKITKRRWHYYVRRSIWRRIPLPILMLVLYLSVGTIALLIRILFPGSFVNLLPVFGTFAFAVFRLFPIAANIGSQTMQIMEALPDCEAIYNIQNVNLTYLVDGEKELDSFNSAIEFDEVTFAYKGRKKVLGDISVRFEKGKTTAIVGCSGSGKSTILNLLLRLFDPDKGTVKVDGLSIKEYKLVSWLNMIGFVGQDTFVFNDTIKNNITLRSEKYSDEEVIQAAKYADAHSFITEMPDGYDTLIGDKGVRLSGGQRQRIAVAQAMIREPEILIFDEATNALDSISEEAIQKAINEISKEHTVIIVAHRLSTIVNADKIITLGEGRVLQEGTHKELLESRGAYWELYRSQAA